MAISKQLYVSTVQTILNRLQSTIVSAMHSQPHGKLVSSQYIQIQHELALRCGEDVITKIKDNWKNIIPKVLELHSSTSSALEEDVKALLIIDKELRGSGTTAKAPAVFSFHEVRV